MQISKREFLKGLGLAGAAFATGGAFGEQVAPGARRKGLPEGCIGDPKQPWFGQHVFPLPHTFEDGPSCLLKDEKAYKRYAATATAGKDAWVLKMTVPFAELDFKPIRINTIRCAPIVTYNFGGLGKDLPCSWEGATPTSVKSWGELVVDIR